MISEKLVYVYTFYILQMIIWGKKHHDADKVPGDGGSADDTIHRESRLTIL